MGFYEKHIFVCDNLRDPAHPRSCCQAKGSTEFLDALKALVREKGLGRKVRVNRSGCLDKCELGALVVIYPENVWYKGVTKADAQEIFESHIVGGTPVERLRVRFDPQDGKVLP